jgi:hypothetical protein
MQTFTTKRSGIILHNPKFGFLHYSRGLGHAGTSRINIQWVDKVEQATILDGWLELDYNTRRDVDVREADWVTVLVTRVLEIDN